MLFRSPVESVSIFSKSSGMKSRSGVINPEDPDLALTHPAVGQLHMDQPNNKHEGLPRSVDKHAPPTDTVPITAGDKPFEPTVPLTTSSIVHFHSSGNQLPEACGIGQAISSLQAQSRSPGINIDSLRSKILYFSVVCPRDRDKEKWKSSVENLERTGRLQKLEDILKEMAQFHRRARDLNKLMKNCVYFWIWKLGLKEQVREERKQTAMTRKAERSKQRLQKQAQAAKKRIEVIDLTVDTSSAASTTFSGSPVVGSHPSNVSVILTSSSSGHKDSANSVGKLNPDAPSFSLLSTTPNRSHSQRKRQKLAFSKLKESIPHACILSALSQILFLSGAYKLLDSNANRRGFLSFVKKSVLLAGMKSTLHLGQLMAMVNPGICSWLSDINDEGMKRHLFANVIHWLYNEYVLMIIRTCFYATEISNCRFQMTFYLRDTWRSISDRMKHQLLRKGCLVQIRRTETEYKLPANARMRLVPKQNLRIRPILSLKPSV